MVPTVPPITPPATATKLKLTYHYKDADTIIIRESTLESFLSYIDYYPVGSVEDAVPVEVLNLQEYNILEVGHRLVYYSGDIIWFSELFRFDYIPHNNYIALPINPTDKITRIIYYRGGYIIFTKDEIFKMSGTFGLSNFEIKSVNKFIGCVAPNTVREIGNELIFLSREGLYKLKSSVFQENLENVEKIDRAISDSITYSENASAVLYNE